MRLALCTNRCSDFLEGEPDVLAQVRQASGIFVPFVVAAELRSGFLAGRRYRENEQKFSRFVTEPRVSILFPDNSTTHHYARVYLQLRKQGTPIPQNDLWIAALVLQHDLTLYSRDKHFEHIPQISRI
jgi:predicted nucleic acid-binding protein